MPFLGWHKPPAVCKVTFDKAPPPTFKEQIMKYMCSLILLLVWSAYSNAECYIASEFVGSSARAESAFQLQPDQMSGQAFRIDISENSSSVSPSNMTCITAGKNTTTCISVTDDGKSVVEAWAVHPAQGKVTYTKVINGYAEFDGGNLLIGKITGKCN